MKNNEKMNLGVASVFLLTALASLFVPIAKFSTYAQIAGIVAGVKQTASLPQWVRIDFSTDAALEFYSSLAQTGKTQSSLIISVVLTLIVLLSLIVTAVLVIWFQGKFRSIVGMASSVSYVILLTKKFFEIQNTARGAAADAGISILTDGEPVMEVHFGLFFLLILGLLCLASCVLSFYMDLNKNPVEQMERADHSKNQEVVYEIHGISGMYAGAVFGVKPGETIIVGRDPSQCQIVIIERNSYVSRKHCLISCDIDGSGFKIVDYSSYGTYIDGQQIQQGVVYSLPFGARFWLGNEENAFSVYRK